MLFIHMLHEISKKRVFYKFKMCYYFIKIGYCTNQQMIYKTYNELEICNGTSKLCYV